MISFLQDYDYKLRAGTYDWTHSFTLLESIWNDWNIKKKIIVKLENQKMKVQFLENKKQITEGSVN